jgi:hypothetical protein
LDDAIVATIGAGLRPAAKRGFPPSPVIAMASVETQALAPAAANACPRCGKPLTDAAGLGWCPACGYCRSLEETAGHAEVAEAEKAKVASVAAAPAAAAAPFVIPAWPFPLLLGMIGLAAVSWYMGTKLAPNSLERALWTTVQIGAGVLLLLLGQFYALMRLAPDDAKLGMKDAILPFRLYGLVFARLPGMKVSVWTLGWGLSAIASALIFIGGLNHWFTYLNKKDPRGAAPVMTPRQ